MDLNLSNLLGGACETCRFTKAVTFSVRTSLPGERLVRGRDLVELREALERRPARPPRAPFSGGGHTLSAGHLLLRACARRPVLGTGGCRGLRAGRLGRLPWADAGRRLVCVIPRLRDISARGGRLGPRVRTCPWVRVPCTRRRLVRRAAVPATRPAASRGKQGP